MKKEFIQNCPECNSEMINRHKGQDFLESISQPTTEQLMIAGMMDSPFGHFTCTKCNYKETYYKHWARCCIKVELIQNESEEKKNDSKR
jgi:hypothetical protein